VEFGSALSLEKIDETKGTMKHERLKSGEGNLAFAA